MKKLIHFLCASSSLLFIGTLAHAQSFGSSGGDDYMIVRSAPRATQMVKYYKPTQTYYGNGYVVRYGYTTTTPSAAGFTTTDARLRASADLYLPVTNSESRRDVTTVRKAVTLPAKEEQLNKRDIQPAATRLQKPQP